MASVQTWCIDTGSATSSPARGTTQSGFGADTHNPTENNWKNVSDNTENSGTAYSAAPITAGQNSFERWLYSRWTGTFNSISNVLWAHTSGTLGTGLTINGAVLSTYTTPSATTNTNLTTNMTSPISIGSGLSVNLSTTGPFDSGATSSQTAACYSNYLVTQLATTTSAAPGDCTSCVFTIQWNES